MAQYGGEQVMKPEGGHQTKDQYATHNAPIQSATAGHDHKIGGTETTTGMGAGLHGGQEAKHGATGGGILHRSGSGSSSSSEDDGEGGRRKKKGVMGKIKDKLPGGDHGSDEVKMTSATETGGHVGEYEGQEKKGLVDKIKEKLPGGN